MSVELLSPAGDFETALSAFDAGADAVYCGLSDFSARAFADNFSMDDLTRLVRFAHAKGRRVHVAFNTLVDEAAISDAIRQLAGLAEIGPDALIVQDLGIARICRRHFPELPLHASTQLVAHNLEGVLALGELGFTRVVLARELSLEEVASIAKRCGGIELECFVHGALCYSVSGLCLFGAMEKGRSGNRGKCPYCCRLAYGSESDGRILAFSMKDLRLGEDVRRLVDAGVVSLKIEGRMKSPLYVASVTRYYRDILGDGPKELPAAGARVNVADLETVFSRRTTELYFAGRTGEAASPIDPDSLGHLGTPIGTVKRITKDREGRRWLRFHTSRSLERHDGLQFANPAGGKPLGFGVSEMRQAISRVSVFEVAAGTDVELLLPEVADLEIHPGQIVYCSMSNAVKRMFPPPGYRASDYPGTVGISPVIRLAGDRVTVRTEVFGETVEVAAEGSYDIAKNPEKTADAIRRAFAKLGGTAYRLVDVVLEDPESRFVPVSVLNDLRRELVERLDTRRCQLNLGRINAAEADDETGDCPGAEACRRLKIRCGQPVPSGDWHEVIVAVGADTSVEELIAYAGRKLRLALPVYTAEPDFNRLRHAVKRFVRAGFTSWEASDLATLRMLKAAGIADLTADWTLYAFNSRALATLRELGVGRTVASPENGRDNLQFLAESGFAVEFLVQQSTPLFVSLTRPAGIDGNGGELRDGEGRTLQVFRRDGLWVTTRAMPRSFEIPAGVASRVDLSWDAIK